MNHTFTKDGSDFDGIPTYYKYYTGTTPGKDAEILTHELNQKPWEQFWDGFKPSNSIYQKTDYVLVTKNFKIKKEDSKGNPIEGISFSQVKDGKYNSLGCTDDKGELLIPINTLKYGESYLTESKCYNRAVTINTHKSKLEEGEIIKTPVEIKPNSLNKKIPIYVDFGVRFLGEVKGTDFITYEGLITELRKRGRMGDLLDLGNDTLTGGNWLKIYDVWKEKPLYIAKKPLTNNVSWDELCSAGVVFGLDQVNADGTLKPHFHTTSRCGTTYKPKIVTINNKQYIVRLLKTTIKDNPNDTRGARNWYTKQYISKSEWNRYIIPLVKNYRVGERSMGDLEEDLKLDKNNNSPMEYIGESNNYKIQLATYNWYGDLTLGTTQSFKYNKKNTYATDIGVKSWTQEAIVGLNLSDYNRTTRGSFDDVGGCSVSGSYKETRSSEYIGFRPVLEEIK